MLGRAHEVSEDIQFALSEIRPLKRSEYHHLIDQGVFQDEHLELLFGQLVRMSPQKGPHSYSVLMLNRLLTPALLGRAYVLVQAPVAASEDSEPEPDISVVPEGDYLDDHPGRAWLVIEVADSSLRRDRTVKRCLYAEWGVPDYWVVNVVEGVIEVHRSPAEGTYQEVTSHGPGETLHLLQFPDVAVRLDEILPPKRDT